MKILRDSYYLCESEDPLLEFARIYQVFATRSGANKNERTSFVIHVRFPLASRDTNPRFVQLPSTFDQERTVQRSHNSTRQHSLVRTE